MTTNIVHLITPFLFHTGPWVYNQIIGLKSFNSIVFTQKIENSDQYPWNNVYSPESFPVHKIILNKAYRKLFDKYGLFYKPLVNKLQPDIFHAHMGYEAVRWLDFIMGTKKPLITTFYGLDVSVLGKIAKWKNKYLELFDYGDIFLCEGNYLKKQLIDLGCDKNKIHVQHLGVDIHNYPMKIYSSTKDRLIKILQVATFREKKGIEYSIQAFAKIAHQYPNSILQIVGSGDNAHANNKVRALVNQLKMSDRVLLKGKMTHKEVIKIMNESDIFIHPSITASNGDNEGGAPVGIIEASAIGLPIVATYHADIPEVVLHNKTGLLSEEKDVEGIAYNLSTLLEDSKMAELFGQNGRKHISQNYSIASQIFSLESVYNRILHHN